MTALTLQQDPAWLAHVDTELLRANRSASKAQETKRALAKNWSAFCAWCHELGAVPLPASAAEVEAYLVYLADRHPVRDRKGKVVRRGLKASAVQQALWTINTMHKLGGFPKPGDSNQVKTAIAGIKRSRCVKDVLRNTKANCSDDFMEAATSLHNLRVEHRKHHLRR